MGTVSRHGNAPFADGETLSGTELEADFNTIYTEFNGSIDNANVKTSAGIAGTKLASGSVTSTQILADTITVATMAPASVTKSSVDYVASVGVLSQTATLSDIAGVTSAILTPGSTNDTIFMDLSFELTWSASPSTNSTFTVAWHINGTDNDDILDSTVQGTDSTGLARTVHSTYALAAPAASSMTIKPRYKTTVSAKTPTIGSLMFRCWILPGKA